MDNSQCNLNNSAATGLRVLVSFSKIQAQCTSVNSSLGLAMQGVLPNMIKLAPAAGISWFMFEEVKRMLGVDVRS